MESGGRPPSGDMGTARRVPPQMPLPSQQAFDILLPHAGAATPEGLPELPGGDGPAAVDEDHPHRRTGVAVPRTGVVGRLPLLPHRQHALRRRERQPGRPAEPEDDEHLQLAEETDQAAHGRTHRRRELLRAHAQGREGRHVRPDAGQDQGRLPRDGGAPCEKSRKIEESKSRRVEKSKSRKIEKPKRLQANFNFPACFRRP